MDFKDKYRLVIATPNAVAPPPKAWAAVDDAVPSGHRQPGLRSNRQGKHQSLLAGGPFAGRHDLEPASSAPTSSSSASTAGSACPEDGWAAIPAAEILLISARVVARPRILPARASRTAGGRGTAPALTAAAQLRELPANEFSFIYETGQNEMDTKGLPETSDMGRKLGCGARVRKADIVDTQAGYVYDSTRQDPGSDAWGRLPRPGTAELFEYPHCAKRPHRRRRCSRKQGPHRRPGAARHRAAHQADALSETQRVEEIGRLLT